jgi:hypothetical protein
MKGKTSPFVKFILWFGDLIKASFYVHYTERVEIKISVALIVQIATKQMCFICH